MINRWTAAAFGALVFGMAVSLLLHRRSDVELSATKPGLVEAVEYSQNALEPVVLGEHPSGLNLGSEVSPADPMKTSLEAIRAEVGSEDNRKLLDAGFSRSHIDWIRHRREELLEQHQLAAKQRRDGGTAALPLDLAVSRDHDLVLRDIMGDAEYVSYRQALGKPTEILVDKVLPGSYAAQAGIQPGDQIVRYGDKRVFDYQELNLLSIKSDLPTRVEVVRASRTTWVTLPKGPTGLSGTFPSDVSRYKDSLRASFGVDSTERR